MKQLILESRLGPLRLIAHKGKLVYCNWVMPDCDAKYKRLSKLLCKELEECNFNDEWQGKDKKTLELANSQLELYFQGEITSFTLPVEMYGTEFQRRVWQEISLIPCGVTISYGDLGERCGGKGMARAVANACGANPLAIIVPCHRVTGMNGKWGGYTGGVEKKISLLSLENHHNHFSPTGTGEILL